MCNKWLGGGRGSSMQWWAGQPCIRRSQFIEDFFSVPWTDEIFFPLDIDALFYFARLHRARLIKREKEREREREYSRRRDIKLSAAGMNQRWCHANRREPYGRSIMSRIMNRLLHLLLVTERSSAVALHIDNLSLSPSLPLSLCLFLNKFLDKLIALAYLKIIELIRGALWQPASYDWNPICNVKIVGETPVLNRL